MRRSLWPLRARTSGLTLLAAARERLMMSDEPVIYEEKQRLNIGLLWLPVLTPAVMVWYSFYWQILRGRPVGSRPAPDAILIILFVVFGFLFPYLMLKTRLILQVRPDGFYFRYLPFHLRYHKISWLEITDVRPVEFSPLLPHIRIYTK
ncbi:MAG: DUF6141 family protein [Candidatus Saccharicenans sp.]|nr:DUF6141 family protein [Candidatus Saccharicenans sp.]MDI6848926.1 DUF6141 family protein [Candidatus Saccharicenans sp.]